MKCLRIVVSILVLLVVIVAVAIACLLMFADPNKLKPVIAEAVMKKTGYHLVMDGKLSWSFYPHFGVKIEHMTLSAPNETTPFVDLHDVKMKGDLSQFLHGTQKLGGNVYISTARLMKLNVHDVSVELRWKGNALVLQPIKAALYEGTLSARAMGQQLASVPHWEWDAQFDQVQLKPLLADINGPNSKLDIAGKGRVNLRASTQGSTRNEMLSHLNGSSDFSLQDGVVEGVDLNYLIASADAYINKAAGTIPPVNTDKTAFSNLTGSLRIENGIATTENLLLTASAFTAQGQGNINLVKQTLNLTLQVKPQQTLKTQWEAPILISGDLHAPDVRLDTRELQKWVVTKEIDKLKTKASEQIKKHIPGKAGEFLQNLIGH